MVGVFLRNQGLVASDPEGPDTLNPSTPRPIRRAYQPRSDPKSHFGSQNQRRWNDLRNTPRDIWLLTNYLPFEYKARAWQPDAARRRDA